MFNTDILFTGFYGQSNTGDDSFVEVASWGAKKFWNKTDSRFLARTRKLPKTIESSRGYPFDIPRTYSVQGQYLLNRTKAFVYAGGSTIHSEISSDNIRLKAFERKSSKGIPKIGGIGVSVGPFKTTKDESSVKEYLKRMDFLAVRDQVSFDFVSSLDLPYKPVNAFDLAALLPEIYDFNKAKSTQIYERKVIGISVCPYESVHKGMNIVNEIKRNTMLIDLLRKIDDSADVHFKFFIINGNERIGDRRLTMETISSLIPKSYEIVDYSPITKSVWESIAACDFVISTRLHAAIFACFAETPFMLNEYHRKCTDFLESVAHRDEYRLYESEYDISEKATRIINVLNGDEAYEFPEKLEEMRSLSKFNFTQVSI